MAEFGRVTKSGALWMWRDASPVTTWIFCFPPAGGSARQYESLAYVVPRHLGLVAVEPPGHGTRAHEPPVDNLTELAHAISDDLFSLLDRPFAIVGHSMGALVGLEVGHAIALILDRRPEALIAAACRPPALVYGNGISHSEERLVEMVRSHGGTPPAVLDDTDYASMLLSTLRADVALTANHTTDRTEPLGCRVRAYLGLDDPSVSSREASGWRAESNGDFDVRMFPGGHFFLTDSPDLVVGALLRDIDAT